MTNRQPLFEKLENRRHYVARVAVPNRTAAFPQQIQPRTP